jgi:hypothetical protein
VALINAVRFSLKSLGYPVSNPSSACFHKLVLKEVPESIGEMIAHNVAAGSIRSFVFRAGLFFFIRSDFARAR